MIRNFILLFTSLFLLSSCNRFDEQIIPVIGVYEANVVGVSGPFSLSISSDVRDDVIIDAPFDGFNWALVYADIDDQDEAIMDFDIDEQEIAPGIFLWGDGFFFDGTIQLDYTIDFGNVVADYTIVGSQF